jgi:hypothetical protein
MITAADVESRARFLLEMDPSPVPRHRLLRDVLQSNPGEPKFRSTKNCLDESRQVKILIDEQRGDGGWGAFHSRSTTSKQRIASTEVAIERALNLGLDTDHSLLIKAKRYLLSIIRGDLPFPDYHEKNDRWPTGMRLLVASTLSLIDPECESIDSERDLWRQIAIQTFKSGTYKEIDEIAAHRALTGATVKDSYLRINNRYALNILGSKEGLLSDDVESALLEWLLELPEGIGYLGVSLSSSPSRYAPGLLDRWLTSLEMLSRLFRRSTEYILGQAQWIWALQGEDGLWDLGSRSSSSTYLPLSDTWHSPKSRKIDWSTRILVLLAKLVT